MLARCVVEGWLVWNTGGGYIKGIFKGNTGGTPGAGYWKGIPAGISESNTGGEYRKRIPGENTRR